MAATANVANARSRRSARVFPAPHQPCARRHGASADAQAVVDAAFEKLGRIDVLVNSTGTNDFPALLHKIAIEDIPGILQRCLSHSF